MSYLVLARKYRPANFAEMVGQDHVVRALTNALQTQRLHHAYLFTGTRGVGKTTVSRILAKSLNCVGSDGAGGITAHPCGVCQACRDIDAGRFVDYVELDAASNRGVDEISQLLEQSVYKPVVGRFKVFMIDEVHMLSNTAFNAMLKTLEEPPDYLKFVLATTDPQKVPVTVLSRCLQFNLRPMAPETVFEHLQQVLVSEQMHFDAGSLRLLSRAAHGSMRDALSLTDQAIAYGNGAIEESAVRQMLGSVDRLHVYQLIEALALGDGKAVIDTVDFMRMQGLCAAAALDEMANVLQRMAVLRVVPEMAQPDDPDDMAIVALVSQMGADEVQLLYSIVLRGTTELGLASDEYAALVMILLRLLAFKPHENAAGAVTPRRKVADMEANTTGQGGLSRPPPKFEKSQELPVREPAPKQTAVPAQMPDNAKASVNISDITPAATVSMALDERAHGSVHEAVAEGQICHESQHSVVAVESLRAVSGLSDNVGNASSSDQAFAGAHQLDEAQDDIPPWVDEVPYQEYKSSAKNPSLSVKQHAPTQQLEAAPEQCLTTEEKGDAHRNTSVQANGQNNGQGGGQVLSAKLDLPPLTPLTERWLEVVGEMLRQDLLKALARELVLNSQIVQVDEGEGVWELCCGRKTLLTLANQQKVAAALEVYLGHAVKVVVTEGQVRDTPALRIQAGEQQKQVKAEQDAAADPLVQKLLGQFPDARIIPGSVKPV